MRKSLLINFIGLLFVLIASFLAIRAFFVPGFFPIHDDTQIARVYEMGKSLHAGMIPVRWVDDLGFGYGYPIFSFYAPLAYYMGGVITLININALVATKIMMALGILLSGVTMYFFGKKLWGIWGGIYSSLFYVYATYHAVDIYVRGDVAEFWAYAFIPLAFLGFYGLHIATGSKPASKYSSNKNQTLNIQITNTKIAYWIVLGSLGYAGIILSHNLTALMVTPFLFTFALYLIFLSQQKACIIVYFLLSIVLSFGLSAFYWLPVFPEMKFTNVLSQVGGSAYFADHFICLKQLWISPWGYGGSAAGCVDGLSFMLGRVYILILIVGLLGIPLFWQKYKKSILPFLFFFMLLLFSLFLTLPYSKFIWDKLRFLAFLQYPWRFLLLVDFFMAIIAGGVVFLYKEKFITFFGRIFTLLFYALILGLLLYTQAKFFQPQRFNGNQVDHYISYPNIEFQASSLSHEYLPKGFTIPQVPTQLPNAVFSVLDSHAKIISQKITTTQKSISVSLAQPTKILIHVAYFPAWHAYLDDTETKLFPTENGMMISVPSGEHKIVFTFQSTFIENIADIISLTSAGLVVLAIIYFVGKKYAKKSI